MKIGHMAWTSKALLPLLFLAISNFKQSQESFAEEAEPLHRMRRVSNYKIVDTDWEKSLLDGSTADQWIDGLTTEEWSDDIKLHEKSISVRSASMREDNPILRLIKTYVNYLNFANGQEGAYSYELVIRSMFNETVSPANYQRTLSKLDREGKSSYDDDNNKKYFWQTFDELCHEDGSLPASISLPDVAATWTNYSRVPVVTINRNYENNTATLSQKVYIEMKGEETNKDLLWTIPIPYTTQDELQFVDRRAKIFLQEKEGVLTGLPDRNKFILANPEYVGFYYVNYDTDNWDLITRYLNSDNFKNIPALTRAQLIHYSGYLCRSGDLSCAHHFRLQLFLRRDLDTAEPWLIKSMTLLNSFLDGTDAWENYKNYLIYLTNPAYQELGEENQEGDSPSRIQARRFVGIIRVFFGASEQVPMYRQEVQKWMESENPDKEVPVSFHSRNFCHISNFASREEWDFLFERYLNLPSSYDSESRDRFLRSLAACLNDDYKVQRILSHILAKKEGITIDQARRVFFKYTVNSCGRSNMLNHLISNLNGWKSLDADHPTLWIDLFTASIGHINTEEYLQKAKKFYDDHKGEFGSEEEEIAERLSRDKVRVQWTEENVGVIKEVLEEINREFENENL